MQFHVEIVQKRQRNIQKNVMPVQSCRFPSKPIVVVVVVFLRSRCTENSSQMENPFWLEFSSLV